MKTNYAPSYEELKVLEKCIEILTLKDYHNHTETTEDLREDLRKVIKSLHHKHMEYELRNVKLNKTK
tara:strand:+ start:1457 stop:1657 length:201 start_codon:yes stop_codon:yes gene_type:complete